MSKARRNVSRRREIKYEEPGEYVLEVLVNDGAPFGENAFKPFINGYNLAFNSKSVAELTARKIFREGLEISNPSIGIEYSKYSPSQIVRVTVHNLDTIKNLSANQQIQIETQSKEILDEAMEVSDQVAIEFLPENLSNINIPADTSQEELA